MMTKEQAVDAAKRVAEELGPPWKPRTWENLGWHASVEINGGYMSDRLDGESTGMTLYIPTLGHDDAYFVMAIDSTIGEGRTAIAAVRRAHKELNRRAVQANRLMAPLWAAMKKSRKR